MDDPGVDLERALHNGRIIKLPYMTKKMLYIAHFLPGIFAYVKKKQYLCSEF